MNSLVLVQLSLLPPPSLQANIYPHKGFRVLYKSQ